MKRCLVIDDSDVIRKVARVLLEHMGFEVSEASDAVAAIELCRTRSPHVLLLDWDLPDISGAAFLERLGTALHERLPLIICCATEHDPVELARARQAGVDAVLMKPLERASLAAALAEVGLA